MIRALRWVLLIGTMAMVCSCAYWRKSTVNENYQQAPADASARAKAAASLAMGYVELGRLDIAKKEVEKGYRLDPRSSEVNNVLGLIHMEIGQFNVSERYFNQALRNEPDNPAYQNNLALLFCKNGSAMRGMQMLREVLANRLYANPEKSLMNAGICSESMGNLSEAERYYAQATKYDSVNLQAQEKLAAIYLRTARADKAWQLINEVIVSASPATANQLRLGILSARANGRMDEAENMTKRLKADYPEEFKSEGVNLSPSMNSTGATGASPQVFYGNMPLSTHPQGAYSAPQGNYSAPQAGYPQQYSPPQNYPVPNYSNGQPGYPQAYPAYEPIPNPQLYQQAPNNVPSPYPTTPYPSYPPNYAPPYQSSPY